jgi:hypothetical protein
MLQVNSNNIRSLIVAAAFVTLALAASGAASAQSSDANFPTPVFTNEVSGRIAPRDVGDPRRTSHFYTFRGTEGDLSVTFDSAELTGDVDVFTATTLRPLIKITLLGDAAHVTKSFYIRSQETLVLRVQARAVGDAEGTYRITFGGSFEPAPPELSNSQAPTAPTVKETGARDRNVRPTTSTGARIEEPAPTETARENATPTPTPSPEATPAPPTRRATSSAARSRTGARTTPRRTRPPASTSQPGATNTNEAKNSNATGEANNAGANSSGDNSSVQPSTTTSSATNSSESTAAAKPAPAARRRPTRSTRQGAGGAGTTSARTEPGAQPSNPPASAEPLPKQFLRIITKNGTMIERDMDTVRRVTVENNQVLVILKDGKIIREPLANVLKMSIEP